MNFVKKFYEKQRKILLIVVVSLLCGILMEGLYNLPVKRQKDYQYIPIENIEMDNFYLVEGSKFMTHGGQATLTIPIEKQFVDKFTYSFEYDHVNAMECDLEISYYDVFAKEPLTEVIHDTNNYVLKESTVNIRKNVDKIVLKMGEGSSPVCISRIAVNNTENISINRFLFVVVIAFVVQILIMAWKSKEEICLEKLFLIIILGIGSVSIFSMPSHKVGFDEEIHFFRAYFMGDVIAGKEELQYPAGVEELTTTSLSNWPYHLHSSEEEMKEENIYRDTLGDYKNNNPQVSQIKKENSSGGLHTISYIFSWIMIKLGMLLGLPFVMVFRMGRMGSLLLYAIVTYCAIAHVKVGKRILFMLALMPTSVMAAITYSYDVWVNAFSFLGFAYLSEEWLSRERKISYKNCVIFAVAFILASLPKAVYIPLILLAFLFPKTKFRSKKEEIIFKTIIGVIFVIMMGTFMLPAVVNPTQLEGDSRGGATNGGQQLAFIFSHPVYYTKILLGSIKDTLFFNTIGSEGLARMGQFTTLANASLIMIVMTYTVVTDYRNDTEYMVWWQRLSCLGVMFLVLCLIWTALYVSYTPVGLNQINGVQGRYYLPVTIWILWALRNRKIQINISPIKDGVILAGLSLLILIPAVYNNIISLCF